MTTRGKSLLHLEINKLNSKKCILQNSFYENKCNSQKICQFENTVKHMTHHRKQNNFIPHSFSKMLRRKHPFSG